VVLESRAVTTVGIEPLDHGAHPPPPPRSSLPGGAAPSWPVLLPLWSSASVFACTTNLCNQQFNTCFFVRLEAADRRRLDRQEFVARQCGQAPAYPASPPR
jgi:hypothetical protein